MLSFKMFKSVLDNMKEMYDKMLAVSNMGIDLYDFCANDYEGMLLDVLVDALDDEDDWVTYWATECEYGHTPMAWIDDDGTEVELYTVEDLWYLITGEIVD